MCVIIRCSQRLTCLPQTFLKLQASDAARADSEPGATVRAPAPSAAAHTVHTPLLSGGSVGLQPTADWHSHSLKQPQAPDAAATPTPTPAPALSLTHDEVMSRVQSSVMTARTLASVLSSALSVGFAALLPPRAVVCATGAFALVGMIPAAYVHETKVMRRLCRCRCRCRGPWPCLCGGLAWRTLLIALDVPCLLCTVCSGWRGQMRVA